MIRLIPTSVAYNTGFMGNEYPEFTMELRGFGNPGGHPADWLGKDLTEYIFPDKAVIKCAHCGQWGARRCECKKCGAPIE